MEEKLNKQQQKKEKQFARMEEVKPEQKNLVRFVDVRWEVMEQDEDGKWHRTGREHSHGLQIENRFYPVTGGPYKMVNRKSFRITKTYEGIPEWATEDLKEQYRREWETHGRGKQQSSLSGTVRQAPPSGTIQKNPLLSTRALELLSVMQTFPANWEHSMSNLKAYIHAGPRIVRRCIDELEDAGYLVKKQVGNERTVYILSENLQTQLSVGTVAANTEEDNLPPW